MTKKPYTGSVAQRIRARRFYRQGRGFESFRGRVCELLRYLRSYEPVEILFGLAWSWRTRQERKGSWVEHILSAEERILDSLNKI
jgi:hypothetical protein